MISVDTTHPSPAPARAWQGKIARHGGPGILLILVLAVVLMASRQSPPAGSRALELPQQALASMEAPPVSKIDHANRYAWLSRRSRAAYVPLRERIPPADGFTRIDVEPGSFPDWLRNLPVAPPDRTVTNHRRQPAIPADDPRIAAVIELQPGAGNLLNGPAMAVRLRAEYAWSSGGLSGLAFHYTSGHVAAWTDWAGGERPVVRGRMVEFERDRPADDSRESFCGYLETLFRYTTIHSVMQDTAAAQDGTIAAGDVFTLGGRLNHAVMVLDVATREQREVRILLGQGGNPAITFHVLRADGGDPWFKVSKSSGISYQGKEWLKLKDLRHWK